MLATLAALHLLFLAQAAPVDPWATPPGEGKLTDDPGSAQPESPQQGNPPLPRRPGAPPPTGATAPAEAQQAPAAPPPPATAAPAAPENLPAPRTIPVRASQLSLLSGESLGGGSAMLAQAGWSQLSILYAQGITPEDDLGGFVDFDWAKTEFRLGAFYRRPLGPAGPFAMAGRLGVAWYANPGGTWIYGSNHADHGFEVNPGLSLSQRTRSGIFSILGEAPITVTLRHDGGLLFSPRASLAYEAPLYDEYTLGARIGLGYRAGAGDAPISGGRAELSFLLVGGYRVF